ncbi:MAG TPA: PhoH family protein, partial [Patescibacteria group bacterium]|nr:PhoH family protein [Patescibacteria group bacterium]
GLSCETYDPEKAVSDADHLYSGYSEVLVDEEFIDRFYKGEVDCLPDELVLPRPFYPNEFLMLCAIGNDKKTALARHLVDGRLKRLVQQGMNAFSVQPRNREQTFAIELLLDPAVKIVSLVGKAGSGKTLCAIAAGLQQTIGGHECEYKKLVVSRPVQPLGKDIGFLPGDVNEKMLPWLMPIQDNLQFLMGNDKETLEEFMHKGTIEIEALTYIRGRSISGAFIIIDESQNLTVHELKTIITRVGENTKIILTGDIEQIDNVFINDVTNGLTHAVEKFKHTELAGHVTLTKGERSDVASLAAKVL